MERRIKKRFIVLILVEVILLLGAGAFIFYVSDYYRAEEYDAGNLLIAEYENFTIYGNTICDTGLIFYPGGKVESKAYLPLMKELVEKGLCCVVVKMPCNLAFLDMNAGNKVRNQLTTVKNWYIAGHSLGGVAAASHVAQNEGYKGLILLASYATKRLENVPVLLILGEKDQVLNRESYEEAKENLADYKELCIEGGNHAYFGNYGEQKGDGSATICAAEQWSKTAQAIVEFMDEGEN